MCGTNEKPYHGKDGLDLGKEQENSSPWPSSNKPGLWVYIVKSL